MRPWRPQSCFKPCFSLCGEKQCCGLSSTKFLQEAAEMLGKSTLSEGRSIGIQSHCHSGQFQKESSSHNSNLISQSPWGKTIAEQEQKAGITIYFTSVAIISKVHNLVITDDYHCHNNDIVGSLHTIRFFKTYEETKRSVLLCLLLEVGDALPDFLQCKRLELFLEWLEAEGQG